MSGQASLDRNVCCFKIANLTHHHHVGILPQDRSKALCKSHICLCIYLGLPYSLNVIFNRVFDSQDIATLIVELVKASVKGGRFSGPSGTRYQ